MIIRQTTHAYYENMSLLWLLTNPYVYLLAFILLLYCIPLQIMWERLYKGGSSLQAGTLMQLRNLINRRNISAQMKVGGHVHEAEDFLRLIVHCHMVAAVMHHFGMSDVNDQPTRNALTVDSSTTPRDKWDQLKAQLESVVDNYIIPRQFARSLAEETSTDLLRSFNPHTRRITTEHSYHCSGSAVTTASSARSLPGTLIRQESRVASESIRRVARDGVFNYASAVLNDGMLLMEFEDAVKEGDGLRILRCWKSMLIYFHTAGHSNYTKEAILLQAVVNAAATPRVAAQVTWSRTVSTRGGIGRNIPVDLHNEHLNHVVKTAISHVGANISTESILQCGKSLKCLMSVLQNFDKQHDVPPPSSAHTQASLAKDEDAILEVLVRKANVFDYVPGREHDSFKNINVNPAESVHLSKLCETIEKYKKELQCKANVAKLFGHSF